jgi:predicted RNase H-like HicB family nuclease
MEKIKVEIYWEEKNYSCGWAAPDFGCILSTGKTIADLKQDFESALKWHIESMREDGEEMPQWAITGEYTIEYSLAVSAILREAVQYTTIAALSRVTGINQKLLSQYANSIKKPRAAQRTRIINGLRDMCQRVSALC